MSRTVTCARHCKSEAGVTLTTIAEITGRSRVTLNRWYYDDPELFDLILDGVRYRLAQLPDPAG